MNVFQAVRPRSLRSKILLLLILFLLLCGIAPAVFFYAEAKQSLKKELVSRLKANAELRFYLLEEYSRDIEHDIQYITRAPGTASALAQFNRDFRRGKREEAYRGISEARAGYLTLIRDTEGIQDVLLFDRDDNLAFSTSEFKPDSARNPALRDAMENAKTLLQTEMSDYVRYGPGHQPLRFLVSPVRDAAGSYLGVAVLVLSNNFVDAVARDYSGLGRTGEIVIAQRQGASALVIAPLRHDPHAAFRLSIPIGADRAVPIQNAVLQREGSAIHVDYRGKSVLAVWRYLPGYRCGMDVKMDTDEIFAPMAALRWQFLILGAGVLLVALGLSILAAGFVTKPVQALMLAVSALQKGKLDCRAEVVSMDEIGALARAFNSMADEIAHSRLELHEKIEALRQAKERYATILRTAAEAFCIVDAKGRFTEVNDAFSRMTGYSREQLLRMTPLDLDLSISPEEFFHSVQKTMATGSDRLESSMRRKDGGRVDLDVNTIHDSSLPGELFVFLQDITERKCAQKALEARVRERTSELEGANRQLRLESTALESAANAIFITDRAGRIQWVNKAFTELTGYTPEEIVGKTPRVLKSGKHDPVLYEDLWATIASGRVWRGELINRRKDGSLYPHETVITPVRGQDKRIEHFIAVSQTITERKQLELRKDQFVTTVSHELRTPMTIIHEGILQIVEGLRGDITDPQKRLLRLVLSNVQRLQRLMDNLMELGDIEAGEIRLKCVPVDMGELVAEVASQFEAKAAEKGLSLEIQKPPAPVEILADAKRLREIVGQLLDNAVRFTQEGGVRVALSVRGGIAECSVADTGIGIAEEDLPKVFGKFEQFSRVYGPGEKGTGLGLVLAKRLVELHHGSIRLESKSDIGTKVTFELPLAA